ncbi:MAG: hypothetical protein R3F43_32785 [bacterium]
MERLGAELVAAGVVGASWPVAARETGVGFLDDHLIVAIEGTPEPARLAVGRAPRRLVSPGL